MENNLWELAALGVILKRLRRMRDMADSQAIRHHYNEVCDRLDVLISKIGNGL